MHIKHLILGIIGSFNAYRLPKGELQGILHEIDKYLFEADLVSNEQLG